MIDRIQPLLAWCERAAAAPEEPVAVDAERASSYRYSSRAYLVQLRTEAAGTALVDPLAFTLPGTLKTLLAEREWVLHAAGQDLPSLAELGLVPGAEITVDGDAVRIAAGPLALTPNLAADTLVVPAS